MTWKNMIASMIISFGTSVAVCGLVAWLFLVKPYHGQCDHLGWTHEGSPPFQAVHCVEREYPYTMHMAPGL